MPVTPFHGGLGLLGKGLAGPRFSFIAFCATQVAIDLESGYHLLRGDWPVHRLFHTAIGATLVCAFVVLALRWLAARTRGPLRDDLASLVPRAGALVAIGAGVLGHLVPDAIMHFDVQPLAPFSEANPLYDLVSLTTLHWGLVICGAVGTVLWLRHVRQARDAR
jgi:cytochrome bd-type quinol oxidase subunit 2